MVYRPDEGPPRPSVCQFTVAVQPVDLDDSQIEPLRVIADGLKMPNTSREVAFVRLNGGQAIMVGDESTVTFPSTITGEEIENTHVTRQIQFIMLFPDERRMAVFGLSTEFVEDWDYCLEVMATIMKTVRFRPPGTRSIADRLANRF
jgi:hypothetical protein